ncbi:MAG: YceD family protein [Anaerolineae bacterium]|nr:YceD family protein [Thermoflexales bacterium]MDW8054068.1 YceD family protein [Anaerolineae bacterium]
MRYRLHKLLHGSVGSTQHEALAEGSTKFDDSLQVPFLRGTFTFTRLRDSIMMRGYFETAVQLQCVRSLEMFEMPLRIAVEDVMFALPNLPAEEPDRVVSDDGWVDITEVLREEIIMAIPINPVHPRFADADPATLLSELGAEEEGDWLSIRLANHPNQTER